MRSEGFRGGLRVRLWEVRFDKDHSCLRCLVFLVFVSVLLNVCLMCLLQLLSVLWVSVMLCQCLGFSVLLVCWLVFFVSCCLVKNTTKTLKNSKQ